MMPVGRFTIASDHPALAGHFPGRPVVPGVVLLDRVLTAIGGARDGRPLCLPVVKFVRPVLPGQIVEVSCSVPRDGRVAFRCAVLDSVVAHGSVSLG